MYEFLLKSVRAKYRKYVHTFLGRKHRDLKEFKD